jgi:hypothetical protein
MLMEKALWLYRTEQLMLCMRAIFSFAGPSRS